MAGEVVETLIVQVEGDLSDLRKEMKSGGGVVKKTSKDMSRSTKAASQGFSNLGKSALKLAAAVGVVGLAFKSIKSIFTEFGAIDALAKTSDRLGITTEALVGLQFAASQTGVESNILGTSLQRLNRRLSEVATTGGGVAKKGLDALGLTAEELLALPLEKQFGLIGDRLNQVASVADKTAIAFGFFDTEGGRLLNTLRLGSDGLAALAKEADDLGIVITRVDAAKIEAANDTLNKLSKTLIGDAQRAAVTLAPAIDFVAGEFVKMNKEADKSSPIMDLVSKAIVVGFRLAQNAVANFRVVFNAVTLGFSKLGEFATQGAIIAVKAFRRMQAGLSGVVFTVLDIADGFVRAFQTASETAGDLWKLIKAGADVAASAVFFLFEKGAQGIGGIIRGLRAAFAAALDASVQVVAAGEGFLDIRAGVAAKLIKASGDIKLANIREAAAAKESVEIASRTLEDSAKAFNEAGADLFTVKLGSGSEALQEMSANFVKLADSQLRASRQGDELTDSLEKNLELIRQNTEEAEAALDASLGEAADVGTATQALKQFENLKKIREDAFQAEIDRRIAHKNELAVINRQARDVDLFEEIAFAEKLSETQQKFNDLQIQQRRTRDRAILTGTSQSLRDLQSLQSSEGKKGFEINKALSIAEATVSTYLAATQAFQAGTAIGSPALGATFAATAIAAGLANINKIRQTQFAGGGGGGGAAGAPSFTAGGEGADGRGGGGVGGGGGQGGRIQTQQFNISLQGDRFPASQVRQLIEDLNDAIGDNATLQVS